MKLTKTELHALIKEALDESHSKADEKKLKKISKQLKGSSKMHAAQADDIDDIVEKNLNLAQESAAKTIMEVEEALGIN